MTESDLIYAAATVDCEGTITIVKHLSTHGKGGISWYRLHVAVEMTSLEIPWWLHNTFGGSFKCYPAYNNPTKHKGTFIWYMDGGKAVYFIFLIQPYLKLKMQQAQVAIKFQESKESRQGIRTTELERDKQEHYRNEMTKLNKRGV